MEKDGRSSAMSEGDGLDEEEDDDDEEGGAETEEQSGNESEMNEQEEEVSSGSSWWNWRKPCVVEPSNQLLSLPSLQEGTDNEEESREEDEEENTDYLTDSNKENETDEENNVRRRLAKITPLLQIVTRYHNSLHHLMETPANHNCTSSNFQKYRFHFAKNCPEYLATDLSMTLVLALSRLNFPLFLTESLILI